jgi:hypothetical protein
MEGRVNQVVDVAAKLESEMREFGQLLERTEREIGTTRIESTTWLDDMVVETSWAEGETEGWRIGYAEVVDTWRFAAKRVREYQEGYDVR